MSLEEVDLAALERLAHVRGEAENRQVLPYKTTHGDRRFTPEQLAQSGVNPEQVFSAEPAGPTPFGLGGRAGIEAAHGVEQRD